MNEMGNQRTPFLFVINFAQTEYIVKPLHEIKEDEIKYSVNDGFITYRNYEEKPCRPIESIFANIVPVEKVVFDEAFTFIQENINFGNSFLTNLTCESKLVTKYELHDIFTFSKAKYKLFIKDFFVSFSPESFIRIDENGKIASFPMKGTIEAVIPNAAQLILEDEKEMYEHTTIVDLIRNDLSKVAEKVWVERFRYLEKVKKQNGEELFQVSSEVCGQLASGWEGRIGDIINELLPAGSISGAPKEKTIELIEKAESLTYQSEGRGFYTGIFGIFDGERMDSAVLIRFIEKRQNDLSYKSGGGITSRSQSEKEYLEMISKIYVPMF